MAAAATAGIVSSNGYGVPPTMANISILNNPTTNTVSASFPEISQLPAFPPNPSLDSLSSINGQSDSTQSITEVIIEALRSKDRLFVLKLGEQMETLITERKTKIDSTPATSYQRLLVHRCSAYYKLTPESDPSSKGIFIHLTPESKIPSRRICELVPVEEIAQPTFKIMRRNFPDRHRLRSHTSHSGSTGEDADLSDIEPSETGSQGGRSNTTGSSSKRHMTIEEREAAYNEARSRIFMDFEEKEKKEKDMSASSSTFSLVSGSASTSAGRDSGSVGDIDDSVSTAATESEWSGPVARDKVRRSGSGNNSAGSSSRSLRSFNANGGSSRGSRATSPSFSYASLYEPPPATYEASQYHGPPVGYVPPYMFPYPPPPPGQAQGQPMMPPYPYYTSYPYHHSQQQPPQHPHSDPTSPTGGVGMFPPPSHPHSQPLPYPPPYIWPHGHPPPPQHPQSAPPNLHQTPVTPPTSNVPQNQNGLYSVPFMPPPSPYGSYVMPYYPPHQSGAQGPLPPPHFQGQPVYPHQMNGTNGAGILNGVGMESNQGRRNGTGGGNNASRRNAPKVRPTWSYSPGTSTGGYPYNGDTVGPRLSHGAMRRTSGNSSAGSGGNRTPGDEASSTASSSTTSSSSRRTYTSTSSKHPLPARPDWAVGLKAQPTLSHHRHHDQNNSSVHPPGGHNGMQSQSNLQLSAVFLQSADFPPLSNMAPPAEKRPPAVAGAWTKSPSTRSIMTPAPSNGSPHGNALVHYPNVIGQDGYERMSSKGSNESFNQKGVRRQSNGNIQEKIKGEAFSDDAVVDRMENMSLGGVNVLDGALEATTAAEDCAEYFER